MVRDGAEDTQHRSPRSAPAWETEAAYNAPRCSGWWADSPAALRPKARPASIDANRRDGAWSEALSEIGPATRWRPARAGLAGSSRRAPPERSTTSRADCSGPAG